jgi:hypothetical protein
LTRLRRENISLRDQLQRSLRELKAYQVKYPSFVKSKEGLENEESSPVWPYNPDIMTPLLAAYDARIQELETIADQQSKRLDDFRNKVTRYNETDYILRR